MDGAWEAVRQAPDCFFMGGLGRGAGAGPGEGAGAGALSQV